MSATQTRDLRTGCPVRQRWRLSSVPHGPLARDATVDVLVVGAGISGAFMAEALSDAGLEVLVVDRRGPVATPAQAKANQRVSIAPSDVPGMNP